MRIRSIKPEFWTSEDVTDLTYFERLLFIGLWSYADDHGRGQDRGALPGRLVARTSRDCRECVARPLEAVGKGSDCPVFRPRRSPVPRRD